MSLFDLSNGGVSLCHKYRTMTIEAFTGPLTRIGQFDWDGRLPQSIGGPQLASIQGKETPLNDFYIIFINYIFKLIFTHVGVLKKRMGYIRRLTIRLRSPIGVHAWPNDHRTRQGTPRD